MLLIYWSSCSRCACPWWNTQWFSWEKSPFGAGHGFAAKKNLKQRRWVGLCGGALKTLTRCLLPPHHNTVTRSTGSAFTSSIIICTCFLSLLLFCPNSSWLHLDLVPEKFYPNSAWQKNIRYFLQQLYLQLLLLPPNDTEYFIVLENRFYLFRVLGDESCCFVSTVVLSPLVHVATVATFTSMCDFRITSLDSSEAEWPDTKSHNPSCFCFLANHQESTWIPPDLEEMCIWGSEGHAPPWLYLCWIKPLW